MDMQKMGSFLKELRTEENLTQEQLGEKIGVTNKTVSRWETGKYMPPVQCLEILSDLYEVSINEIIAGERLEVDSFKDSAEENLKAALNKIEKENEKFEKRMTAILIITTILAICAIFLVPVGTMSGAIDKVRGILVIGLIFAITFIANTLNIVAVAAKKYQQSDDI